MTLRLLRPSLATLRGPLAELRHVAKETPSTERLRGKALVLLRRRLLARSGSLCECYACRSSGFPLRLTWATFEVNHVERVADGGTHALDNLQAVHKDCHARITAKQNAEVALYGCVLPEPVPRRLVDDEIAC